jgi:hypothetical protein
MNLGHANFLVKTDDDVYINTPKLMDHLDYISVKIRSDNNADALNYMGGLVFSGRAPHTLNSFSKWYVPPDLWEDQKTEIEAITKDSYDHKGYPDYLEGNFYVISGPTAQLILNTSVELPLYHLEDVYVTGFIGSEILQIKLDNVPHTFTSSASWPRLMFWYTKLQVNPKDMIVYHCDHDVNIIKQIYSESTLVDP